MIVDLMLDHLSANHEFFAQSVDLLIVEAQRVRWGELLVATVHHDSGPPPRVGGPPVPLTWRVPAFRRMEHRFRSTRGEAQKAKQPMAYRWESGYQEHGRRPACSRKER